MKLLLGLLFTGLLFAQAPMPGWNSGGNGGGGSGPFLLTGQTSATPTNPAAGNTSLFFPTAGGPGGVDSSGNVYGMPSSAILSLAANTFWAGPTTGAAAAPTGRAIVAADLPSGTPNTATATAWTAGQSGTPVTVTISTATFTPNMASGNNFNITLIHASCPCTLANPTNIVAGQSGLLVINQSATGSDLITTYGSDWKFSGGTKPLLTTSSSALDMLPYYVVDSTHIVVGAGVLNAQ